MEQFDLDRELRRKSYVGDFDFAGSSLILLAETVCCPPTPPRSIIGDQVPPGARLRSSFLVGLLKREQVVAIIQHEQGGFRGHSNL